jgi:hypothetical protein
LKPITNCDADVGVVFSKFIVSSFEPVTTSYGYGGELSSSTSLLVIELADIRISNFLL